MNLKHLKKIRFSIPFETLENQAKYADSVCVENINDKNFINSQFKNIVVDNHTQFAEWNATSVGNIAFVSLNCNIPEISEKCNLLLENYRNWITLNPLIKN